MFRRYNDTHPAAPGAAAATARGVAVTEHKNAGSSSRSPPKPISELSNGGEWGMQPESSEVRQRWSGRRSRRYQHWESLRLLALPLSCGANQKGACSGHIFMH